MKKILVFTASIVLILSSCIKKPYDSEAVKARMKAAVMNLQSIQVALEKNEIAEVKRNFDELTENFSTLKDFTPPKDSKRTWKKLCKEIAVLSSDASLKADQNDIDGIKRILEQIVELTKQGHETFR